MGKKVTNLTTGKSEPAIVAAYMQQLQHPMMDTIVALRAFFLSIDPRISEGIYWNVPTFYYSGSMQPFEPKEYKRYLVGFNFYKQDAIRLIFLKGASAPDPNGVLEGDYTDGRRIMSIKGIADMDSKKPDLTVIIKGLIALMA